MATMNDESNHAATNEGDDPRSQVGLGGVEEVQAGRDGCGQEHCAPDCCERELLDADGDQDRELLSETRGGQESEGLATGGEGLPVAGEDRMGTLGRDASNLVGEEASTFGGTGGCTQFADPEFAAKLGARKANDLIELAAPLTFASIDPETNAIAGVSVITRGEAKGHYMWVDREFLVAVNEQLSGIDKLKCRFGHPSMFRDDRPTLGYFTDPTVEGEQVKASLSFLKVAKNLPGYGDVQSYITGIAEEAPEFIGTSIVFSRDINAEDAFIEGNIQKDKDGMSRFVSPDPMNALNLPHARLGKLMACDIVDSPAANAGGLFSDTPVGKDIVRYILGESTELPEGLSPSVYAEAEAGRTAFSEIMGDEGDEPMELDTDVQTEDENIEILDGGTIGVTLISFDGVAAAASQIPRRALLGKTEEGEREGIASLYAEFDAKAPWDRDPEGWSLFELWCAHTDKRGLILDDETIAAQLDLLGFHREAAAIEAILFGDEDAEMEDGEDDEDDDGDDAPEVECDEPESENEAQFDDGDEISLDEIRDLTRSVINELLTRHTGRLPD